MLLDNEYIGLHTPIMVLVYLYEGSPQVFHQEQDS